MTRRTRSAPKPPVTASLSSQSSSLSNRRTPRLLPLSRLSFSRRGRGLPNRKLGTTHRDPVNYAIPEYVEAILTLAKDSTEIWLRSRSPVGGKLVLPTVVRLAIF